MRGTQRVQVKAGSPCSEGLVKGHGGLRDGSFNPRAKECHGQTCRPSAQSYVSVFFNEGSEARVEGPKQRQASVTSEFLTQGPP